jgi:uncharacterized membrane protein YfcA
VGDLTLAVWLWLALAAMLVGVAKTAINGVGSIAVVIFAFALPARESTGAILPLLICGDLIAVSWYRRNADWSTLWRLLPGVVPGLVLGAWFVSVVDDALMRRTIAAILLVMCSAQLWQLLHSAGRPATGSTRRPHRLTTIGTGSAAGFATMAANAAGPVTTVYLIQAGLPMLRMIGTGAWFYLAVNLVKVPFSAGLGLITPTSLLRDALLVPALLMGGGLGILLVGRLRQRQFEVAALGFSVATAVLLLV